jgi:hypothetical protein
MSMPNTPISSPSQFKRGITMFTITVNQFFSFGLFHQDPLKKEAKREIRQLENACYDVLDRLLDHRVFSTEHCEYLLSKAQMFSRQAGEFFKAKQYARAKMAAQIGNLYIGVALQLNYREDEGLFFC